MRDPSAARLFDRRLFLSAAILFPLIVLAGFARTYYLRAFFDVPPPSPVVQVHGLLMTAWIALFGTQVWFISSHRVRLHQRLGYIGIGLGVLIIATGLLTALRAAKYGSTSTPPDVPPLAFMIVPLFDLVMFAILFGAAIYYRRRPAAHKRLMLLTVVNFLPPAIARIPVPSLQALGPLWFFGFPTAVMLLCLFLDARRHGVNRMYVTGMLLLIASYGVRLAIMGTDTWMQVARWMTSHI